MCNVLIRNFGKAIYMNGTLFPAKVEIEVHSEAADDPGYTGGSSSIRVNGIEYCPKKRGHNVVVLSPSGRIQHTI